MKIFRLSMILLLTGSICLAAAGASVSAQQQELSAKLIRLHVIANSDSPLDQQQKLKVRDAVMSAIGKNDWSSREESRQWLEENLQELCDVALQTLYREGNPQRVSAQLCREQYPTRVYDDFSLPSGEYTSLKLVIGEGKGQNWWCVVYPAICMPAAGKDFASEAVSAGLSGKEISLISEDTREVKIKFKLLEMLQNLQNYLQDT